MNKPNTWEELETQFVREDFKKEYKFAAVGLKGTIYPRSVKWPLI